MVLGRRAVIRAAVSGVSLAVGVHAATHRPTAGRQVAQVIEQRLVPAPNNEALTNEGLTGDPSGRGLAPTELTGELSELFEAGTAMVVPSERLKLLRKLARGPLKLAGPEKAMAKEFITASLVRKIAIAAQRGLYEITPQGRNCIVTSAAARRLERRAPPRAETGLDLITRFRATIETVADMQAACWEVISRCDSCTLSVSVDLDQLSWSKGAATVLWDRREPCPCPGCHGERRFLGRSPGGGGYQALRGQG